MEARGGCWTGFPAAPGSTALLCTNPAELGGGAPGWCWRVVPKWIGAGEVVRCKLGWALAAGGGPRLSGSSSPCCRYLLSSTGSLQWGIMSWKLQQLHCDMKTEHTFLTKFCLWAHDFLRKIDKDWWWTKDKLPVSRQTGCTRPSRQSWGGLWAGFLFWDCPSHTERATLGHRKWQVGWGPYSRGCMHLERGKRIVNKNMNTCQCRRWNIFVADKDVLKMNIKSYLKLH